MKGRRKLQEASNKRHANLEASILTAMRKSQEVEKLQREKDRTVARAGSLEK